MFWLFRIICFCVLINSYLFSHDISSDDDYTAEKIADIFYRLNGDPLDPHRKINHSKGFCASGEFIPSKSLDIDVPLLKTSKINAQIRYSLGGIIINDKNKSRGMALRLLGDKEQWTMVMTNTEINFAKNPKEFSEFFEMRIPINGKVDTEKISKMTKEVASYKNFEAYINKIGISKLENTPYYSIHTFMFNKGDKMYPARFKFVPKDGIKYLSEKELSKLDKDFLASEFKAYISNKPIEYEMYLVYANKGDPIDDVTALWSGKHKEDYIGMLKVDKYVGEGCNKDVFFPSDLPNGVNPPKDPLFDIRNATYGITFGRRQ